jgi:hypothetical protein
MLLIEKQEKSAVRRELATGGQTTNESVKKIVFLRHLEPSFHLTLNE